MDCRKIEPASSADRLRRISTTDMWVSTFGGVHLDIKDTWPLGTGGVKRRNLWTSSFSVIGLHLRSVVVNLEVNDPMSCVDSGTVGRKGSHVAVLSLSMLCYLTNGYGCFGRKSCLLVQVICIIFPEIAVTTYQIAWRREPQHRSKNMGVIETQNPYESKFDLKYIILCNILVFGAHRLRATYKISSGLLFQSWNIWSVISEGAMGLVSLLLS